MTVHEEFVCALTFLSGQMDALIHVGGTIGVPHDVLHLGLASRRWHRSRCHVRGPEGAEYSRRIDSSIPVSYTHLTLPTNREV